MKRGNAQWVLLHIEFQGPGGKAKISSRMLHYFSLLYAHYEKIPEALLILTAPHKGRTDEITRKGIYTEVSYKYRCVDLTVLPDKDLHDSASLADLLLYAVKRVVKINCKRQSERNKIKADLLIELERVLNEQGWEPEKVIIAKHLIWGLCNLPEILQKKVRKTLEEEGIKMEYMTVWEKKGYNKGKSRMARLVQLLLGEKRYDDLNRASTDESYCNSLFEAYGI